MYSVIIVDDSAVMRRVLTDLINSFEDFSVVSTAVDAYDAREKIKRYEPTLITLDINMPRMNGVEFLKNLMRLHPMPTVVISGESARGSEVFDDGAIGFVEKQKNTESIDSFSTRLEKTLRSLSFMFDKYMISKPLPIKKELVNLMNGVEKKVHPDELLALTSCGHSNAKIIAIGSSTGGVEALLNVFQKLPSKLPPIIITQHIPYGFSSSFAQRLNSESQVDVVEAVGGEILESSCAYLAPGNRHITIEKQGSNFIIKLLDGVKVSRHKPSVDIMFRSVHNIFGKSAMGVIMTGMGDDGSIGLKNMFDCGAYTISQSERSCIVYGMPKKAVENGAIVKSNIDLDDIAKEIISYSNR